MRPKGSGNSNDTRRAWEPPALTVMAIGTETKSAQAEAAAPQEPSPPPAPSTKLGFSFEMAFPLSARIQD